MHRNFSAQCFFLGWSIVWWYNLISAIFPKAIVCFQSWNLPSILYPPNCILVNSFKIIWFLSVLYCLSRSTQRSLKYHFVLEIEIVQLRRQVFILLQFHKRNYYFEKVHSATLSTSPLTCPHHPLQELDKSPTLPEFQG